MDQGANQPTQTSIGSNNLGQPSMASDPNIAKEAPMAQPASQVPTVTQELPQEAAKLEQPENFQKPGDNPPPTSSPDISSVVTTFSGGEKPSKIIWVVLGILLLIIISVGGYFVYTGLSEKQSDPDQSLTALPTPILLPTAVPTLMPTSTPIPEATASATLSLCEEVLNQATQSAHQASFCQGTFCSEAVTQVECIEIDVVATEGGALSIDEFSDGIGDCVWDELVSGFGSKCKVKYE